MATVGKKNSTIFPHSWFKALDKLPDDVAGRIYKAVQRLDITGEMTTFEEGSIEDVLFSQYADQTDGFKKSYAEKCENMSKAAREREAKKAQKSTTDHNEAQQKSIVLDRSGVDRIGKDRIGKDVSGGDVSGKDASAASPRTTLTTTTSEEIVSSWNDVPCTNDISSALFPDQRRDRTEMAMAICGGLAQFLQLISGLEAQAYFKDRDVDYDWFVEPKNFQNILEGKYKEPRKKKKEGWE